MLGECYIPKNTLFISYIMQQATFILMDSGEDNMDGHCEVVDMSTSKCLETYIQYVHA